MSRYLNQNLSKRIFKRIFPDLYTDIKKRIVPDDESELFCSFKIVTPENHQYSEVPFIELTKNICGKKVLHGRYEIDKSSEKIIQRIS